MRAALALVAALILVTAVAEARSERGSRASASNRWVSMVVDKIDAVGNRGLDEGGGRGSVTIRVRVAADGSLDGIEIEEGSGSKALDERAIRAVREAAPFRPPPRGLLTLEGYTELSFPLQLGRTVAQ